MDVLGIPTVLVPPNPGNVSAFGLLTVDVKNDYVQTHVALADALDAGRRRPAFDGLTAQAGRGAGQGGLRARGAPGRPHRRPALLRPGLRGAGAGPDGAVDAAAGRGRRRVPRRAQGALRLRLRRRPDPAGRVGQPPRLRHRPDPAPRDPRGRRVAMEVARAACRGPRPRGRSASTPGGVRRDPLTDAPACHRAPGRGPAIIEEFGSTVPLHPGFNARVDEYLNMIVTRSEA